MSGKNLEQPNLFNFATSELSQDALIAWLAQWADKKYEVTDKALHKCAQLFIKKLLGKDNYQVTDVISGRQWENIDVWILVNSQYFIIIEDKKGTKEHSDQLERYKIIAEKKYISSSIR